VSGTKGRGGTAGRSGRKPTPTPLKLLAGNPGRRPLSQAEPTPAPRLPRAPEHLGPEARKEWRRAGRFLLQLGLVSDLDHAALAAYCTAYGRWVEAEQALKAYGLMLKSPNGFPVQSPYLAVANRALEQMRSLLSEFGMSPASRSRVSATPAQPQDPFEAFLRQRA
jgi:P27 family predicted phage terminase small subunit